MAHLQPERDEPYSLLVTFCPDLLTEATLQIKLGMRTGEVVDVAESLDPAELHALLTACAQADDPFEAVALDLFESQEIHYITWIEIDGVRKDEPFEYEGIPRWWEPGYEPPEVIDTGEGVARQ